MQVPPTDEFLLEGLSRVINFLSYPPRHAVAQQYDPDAINEAGYWDARTAGERLYSVEVLMQVSSAGVG